MKRRGERHDLYHQWAWTGVLPRKTGFEKRVTWGARSFHEAERPAYIEKRHNSTRLKSEEKRAPTKNVGLVQRGEERIGKAGQNWEGNDGKAHNYIGGVFGGKEKQRNCYTPKGGRGTEGLPSDTGKKEIALGKYGSQSYLWWRKEERKTSEVT